MTFKRVILIVIVGAASLATLPYSVPVLVVAGGVAWVRRRRLDRMIPTARVYELQLTRLEQRLAEATRETEALVRVKYTAWKLRHQKERQYFIAHGVTLPQTAMRAREDEMFALLEQRMRDEQKRFRDELRQAERDERYRLDRQQRQLEDQSREEEARRLAAEQQVLEQARMEAEKEAALIIAKALQQDLA
jgi:hypothetical protein